MERERNLSQPETTSETQKERAAELYRHSGLTYSKFLGAARDAMQTFDKTFDIRVFHKGEYSNEEMDRIEEKVNEARAGLNTNEGAPSAPIQTPEESRTPVTPEVVPSRSSRKGELGKTALAVTAAAAVGAGVMFGALGGGANGIDAKKSDKSQEQKQEQEQEQEQEQTGEQADEQADEIAEAQEAGESFDISDNYRGRYADDTGNNTNPKKIGRNGQEAPYNFGEAFPFTTEEAARKEVQEIAMHEPVMFSAWYYDLNDSLKVPGTEGKSMAELKDLMDEDSNKHREMVEAFLSVSDDASYREGTITGDYTNVFARTTGGNGEQITSKNTEAVHCTTHEDGSKVIIMEYKLPNGKTDTLIFREACGLQNVRPTGTPESEKIIKNNPEIPTPEPDKPGGGDEPTPDPEPKVDPKEPSREKTPFNPKELFPGDGAGDTWEPDPGAITDKTITEEPEAPAEGDFHDDTGNYEEPEAPSEDAKGAEQQPAEQVDPKVQEGRQEAAEQQRKANESGHEANRNNDNRGERSAGDMERDLKEYANDDGTINGEDIPY